jgi:hypothetical protein
VSRTVRDAPVQTVSVIYFLANGQIGPSPFDLVQMSTTTPTRVDLSAHYPLARADRDEVSRQLERILESSVFGTSKRYPAFLRFVVETTLDGRAECLKERTIGVEVFGRAADYDTNSDHVVRSAAGEVRRRLSQYYADAGHSSEVRVELPLGSYIPQFRLPPAEVPAAGIVQVSARAPAIGEYGQAWKKYRKLWMVLPIAASLLFAFRGSFGSQQIELDRFWNPVFATTRPVLICLGSRLGGTATRPSPVGQVGTQDDANAAARNDSLASNPLMRPVTMTDAVTLARLTDYMGMRHSPYRILNPDVTTLEDLRDSPAVLIGVRNNDWAIKSAGKLRFTFDVTSRPVAIRDSQNPSRSWSTTPGLSGMESGRDYAIVSRVTDPGVEQVIVTVGGLGPNGTLAAGEFVTNDAYMKKLESFAPSGWQRGNLQAVISTEVVRGSSGPPRIETAYFW